MVAGGMAPDELVSLRIVDVKGVEAVENSGEWIAEAVPTRERIFQRDPNDSRIVHVTEIVGDKETKRSYKMDTNFWGNTVFKRM